MTPTSPFPAWVRGFSRVIGANVTPKELTFTFDGTLTADAAVPVKTDAVSPATETRAITTFNRLAPRILKWSRICLALLHYVRRTTCLGASTHESQLWCHPY